MSALIRNLILVVAFAVGQPLFGSEKTVVIASNVSDSVGGASLSFSIGYGLPIGQQNLLNFYNKHTFINLDNSNKQISVSFGEGLHINADLSFLKHKKTIGIGLTIEYLLSRKFEAEYVREYYDMSNAIVTSFESFTYWAKGGFLSPYLNVHAQNQSRRIELIAKLGPKVGLPIIYFNHGYYVEKNNSVVDQLEKWKYYSGISIGGFCAFDLVYNHSSSIRFLSSISIHTVSFAPKKGKMMSFMNNGVEQIDSLPVRYKSVLFEWAYDEIYTSPIPDNQPNVSLRNFFPFSSVTISFGINYFIPSRKSFDF